MDNPRSANSNNRLR